MAKEFFAKIKQRFVKNEKGKIATFLISLISIKHNGKGKGKKRKKDKKVRDTAPQKKQQKKLDDPEDTSCFFCKVEGHSLVCSKVNLTLVPRHTW